MSTLLLTVVIPTHNRPRFLGRAIDSALTSGPAGEVEVIVVPNGPDESWRQVAVRYTNQTAVLWEPIPVANANAARNHGMELATGKYLRFLDDDDYLYPSAAAAQLLELDQSQKDVSIGEVDRVDVNDNVINRIKHTRYRDFAAVVLSATPLTVPVGAVYRYDAVKCCRWELGVTKRQDVYWNYDIVRQRDMALHVALGAVGAWVQHGGPRTSRGHDTNTVARDTANRTIALIAALDQKNRLTAERRQAAADRLWRCVHDAAMFDRRYWSTIASQARGLSRHGNPRTAIYRVSLIRRINPWIVESALIPWRQLRRSLGHEYRI